jgi:uncharacterized repeat protein (TIGR01451 family)
MSLRWMSAKEHILMNGFKSLRSVVALCGALSGMSALSGCQSSSGSAALGSRTGPNAHRTEGGATRMEAPAMKSDAGATSAAGAKSEPAAKSAARASSPAATSVAELAFPTGDRATSAILLRQTSPSEMRVGREYDCTVDVINLTSGDLRNVVVNLENSKNVEILGSTPDSVKSPDGDVAWMLGDLPGGATKTIVVKAKAQGVGVASNCLSVVYANVLCASTAVVEPSLELAKSATPEVCGTCQEVKLTYTVKNPGTGLAEAVVIKDTLPAGLTTLDGKNAVEINVGDLAGGAERSFNVTAKAAKAGSYASAASAMSGGGLSAKSGEPATVVKEPKLTVTCDAIRRVFVGRDLTYRFTVKNEGTCAATAAAVKVAVPSGTQFVSADNGGKLEAGSVVWRMPTVAAGQSATVAMVVRPGAVGSAAVTATVAAECLDATSTNCATEVAGIPAILLEVVDTLDPVEVGKETVFVVTATNQGSATDRNVKVVATLPASMAFVSGTGASAVSGSGQTVTMSPVPTLAAGAKAEWRITVRAVKAEDARSRWEMTSEQFKTPVIETESTFLFE